jgi:very-long-chain enoyl-CoA reductase
MPPGAQNVISYAVTLVVFLVVGFGRQNSVTESFAVCATLWTIHFLRRTLESAFIHVYARPLVPVADVVGEYVYYWGFSFWIAWGASSPDHILPTMPVLLLGLSGFLVGEAGNFICHLKLRQLRGAGSKDRRIPHGFLFEYVSCPHYFFEILSWIGFTMVAQTWGSLAFLVVGSFILGSWALKRHRAYIQQFDGREGRKLYPDNRKSLVPYLF